MSGRESERIVLVLQGDWAFWSRWQRYRCLEQREVKLQAAGVAPGKVNSGKATPGKARQARGTVGNAVGSTREHGTVTQASVSFGNRSPATALPEDDDAESVLRCPWTGRGETLIDVVVDGPLDEIDRVFSSADPWPRGFRALGRRLSCWQMGWRHPEAAVRLVSLSPEDDTDGGSAEQGPRVAPVVSGALLRCGIPEPWQQWLTRLQSGSVTIRRVFSAIRLDRGPVGVERVLQVAFGREHERHTLFMGGCPIFTRVVAVHDAAVSTEALAESRAHVARLQGMPLVDVDRVDDADGHRLAALAIRGCSEPVRTTLLEPYRILREQRRLQVLTGATALIAGVAVLIAVVHGVDSARERARTSAAEEVLEHRMTQHAQRLEAAHDDPSLATETLELFDARIDMAAPAAADVLRGLADVLGAHPSIAVDRLAWHTRDRAYAVEGTTTDLDEELSEWSGSAADLPPRVFSDVRPDAVDNTAGGGFSLQFSGHVRPLGEAPKALPPVAEKRPSAPLAATIGERQRRFEAFVDALDERTRPRGLRVKLSPATAASDGGPNVGVRPIDYELRLLYTKSG